MGTSSSLSFEEKAVETALEAIKQQITLSSAVVGGTVAFASSLKEASVQSIWEQLPWALVPFAIAIVFGVIALQSISFELKEGRLPFGSRIVRVSGIIQNLSFLWGFVALVVIVMRS